MRNVGIGGGGGGRHPWPVVFGRVAGQGFEWQVGLYFPIEQNQETVFRDCFADDGEIKVPFVKDRPGDGFFFRFQDHQHPLLGFRQHHLVGGHVQLAGGHLIQVQPDSQIALVAHFDRRTGQAGSAHVLNGNHGTRGHQFQTGLHQPLFGKGVADLDGGALILDRVVEFRAGHSGPADSVAPGFGPKVNHGHADAGGSGVEDFIRIGEACGKGVHKAIAIVRAVKPDFAPYGGHAKAVAVAADALHHACDQSLGFGVGGDTETEGIHRRNRACAHGEHIAQDAANARSRPLGRFDVAGVVVGLHFEYERLAVTNVHDTCVFTRAANDLRARSGQGAQPFLAGFIRAMFVPHR